MSFHVLALAEHPLSCVCLRETFLPQSISVFHTCVHCKETFLLFATAKHHPNDFPENPEYSTSEQEGWLWKGTQGSADRALKCRGRLGSTVLLTELTKSEGTSDTGV